MSERLSRMLDRLARPRVGTGSRQWSAFEVSGYVGCAGGTALALGLALMTGLSPAVVAVTVAVGVATFFAAVVASRIVFGGPRLNTYWCCAAVLLAMAGTLSVLDLPVLAYLDVAGVGLCLFVACGRIGCLMVGCCHGRPHTFGVAYRSEHVADGFPACYQGVRLFPVQAVEATALVVVAAAGSIVVLRNDPFGTAFASCVVAYAVVRSVLEFGRGDAERRWWLGVSVPQLLGFASSCMVVVLESAGLLPYSWTHTAAAGLLVVVLAVAVILSLVPRYAVLSARHLREIAWALAATQADSDTPSPRRTSLGVVLSRSLYRDGDTGIAHYALSWPERGMSNGVARALVTAIRAMRHPHAPARLVRGGGSVFHLLVRTEIGGPEVSGSLGHPHRIWGDYPRSYVVTVTPGPSRSGPCS